MDATFTLDSPRANDLEFHLGGKEFLRFTTDRKIILAPDVTPDEAAQKFLECLAKSIGFDLRHTKIGMR